MKEVVFIGTSPINLLKGYLLGQSGEVKITFVDNHDRLGGAWYSDISPKGHEIECGCHIWTYCPEVYNYLEKELGLNMAKMDPNPIFRYKRFKFSYPLYTIFNSYRFIAKKFFTFNFKALKEIKNNPEIYLKLFGKKNQYPIEGSPVLMNTLKKMMDQMDNIDFIFGSSIDEVHCEDKLRLKLNDRELTCDQLFTTSVSAIKKIYKEGSDLDISHKRRDYIHLLIESDQKPLKKITYDRLVNDPNLHRICDISYQTKHEENLYLIGILEEPFYNTDNEVLKDYITDYLKSQKALSQNAKTKVVKEHIFPTYYINQEEREKVEQIDERIELFYSIDLMYGFYYILKEHGKIK